jgi:hypothetical protein
MRRVLPFALVAVVSLAVWFSLANAREPVPVQGPAPRAWEYKVVIAAKEFQAALQGAFQGGRDQEPDPLDKLGEAMQQKFNALGQEGWEYAGDINGAVVFKRPKL